jgi:hypothetical protein
VTVDLPDSETTPESTVATEREKFLREARFYSNQAASLAILNYHTKLLEHPDLDDDHIPDIYDPEPDMSYYYDDDHDGYVNGRDKFPLDSNYD